MAGAKLFDFEPRKPKGKEKPDGSGVSAARKAAAARVAKALGIKGEVDADELRDAMRTLQDLDDDDDDEMELE